LKTTFYNNSTAVSSYNDSTAVSSYNNSTAVSSYNNSTAVSSYNDSTAVGSYNDSTAVSSVYWVATPKSRCKFTLINDFTEKGISNVVRISQLHMKSDTFLFSYMDTLDIPFPSEVTFFRRQRNLFCPMVERAWRKIKQN